MCVHGSVNTYLALAVRLCSPLALPSSRHPVPDICDTSTTHLAILLLWLARRCHRTAHIHTPVGILSLLLGWFQYLRNGSILARLAK